jgi:cytochrome b6-f complex iron-sulfur subunit
MIRPHDETSVQAGGLIARLKRRQLLRMGFLGGTLLAVGELSAVLLPFFWVNKITGLGGKIAVGKKADILAKFQATKDEPILFTEGKFFLIHAPSAVAAIYRRCTHLGCAVPWNTAEDQFHCPCHGSLFDKHTATVKGGPAPRPLDLFHVSDQGGTIIVDTNPLNLQVRASNAWDPKHAEVTDA